MELAPQDQLELLALSLVSSTPRPPGRPRKDALPGGTIAQPLTQTFEPTAPTPYARAHYCKCGQCRVCVQNAEWDAKFNRKFGESMKDYYSGTRPTRQQSWWADL